MDIFTKISHFKIIGEVMQSITHVPLWANDNNVCDFILNMSSMTLYVDIFIYISA